MCAATPQGIWGCSAFGDTTEAAAHEIGDATLAWIADPVSEPTTKAGQAA